MSTVIIPTWQDARIQPRKYTANGKPVASSIEHYTRRLANQILAYEGKELFSCLGKMPAFTSYTSGASRVKWRFRAKTSPHVTSANVFMILAMQDNVAIPSDPHVVCELFDPAQVDPISGGDLNLGNVAHHYGLGSTAGAHSDTPDTFSAVFGTIAVTGDTEIYGTFTEHDRARLVAAVVYEGSPAHDTANGYLGPAPGQGDNIYTSDRENLTTIVNDSWAGCGAHVFTVNCNDDGSAYTLVGSTPTNLIDQSSTTVSAATPGFFFDGTGKALSRETGVNLTMWAYGSSTDESYIDVVNSSGTVIEQLIIGALGWHSITFRLPASSAKYDLHLYSSTGETATLYAVSIYESL